MLINNRDLHGENTDSCSHEDFFSNKWENSSLFFIQSYEKERTLYWILWFYCMYQDMIKTSSVPWQVLQFGKDGPRWTTTHDTLHCHYFFFLRKTRPKWKTKYTLTAFIVIKRVSSSRALLIKWVSFEPGFENHNWRATSDVGWCQQQKGSVTFLLKPGPCDLEEALTGGSEGPRSYVRMNDICYVAGGQGVKIFKIHQQYFTYPRLLWKSVQRG